MLKIFNDKEYAEVAEQFIEQNHIFADVLCKEPQAQILEGLYSLAYHEYNRKQYKNSEFLFRSLCFIAHDRTDAWLGLGASLQAQQRYNEAIEAYSFAGVLSPEDPSAPLYAGECYLLLGELKKAEQALNVAEKWCAENSGYGAQHQRIQRLLANCTSSLGGAAGPMGKSNIF